MILFQTGDRPAMIQSAHAYEMGISLLRGPEWPVSNAADELVEVKNPDRPRRLL